jgi:DNA-binding transcriptional LysR family regulator
MDKLNSMQHFVEVVNRGSFTRAAEKTGLSRSQISKSVMQLESFLGARLLNRTTRRISLTEIGQIFYERCAEILQEVEAAEAVAREMTDNPSGTLHLAAPTSFGVRHLQQLLPRYLQQYPDVQLKLSLSDRFIDVVEEGFDLVIRITELADSSLVSRRIAPCKRVFCASPGYLEQHGTPQVPQDLSIHRCLVYSNSLKPDTWELRGPGGLESVRINGPFCSDNGDVLQAAAVAGLGITLLPTFIVGEDLQAGRLHEVLQDYCPPEISIYAVFPSRKFMSAKVRSFIDFLASHFTDEPYWDSPAEDHG